jgi:hypothetical protein
MKIERVDSMARARCLCCVSSGWGLWPMGVTLQ